MARRSAVARAAVFGATGVGALSRQEVGAMFDNLGSDAQVIPLNLTLARSGAAWTTAVGATPSGGVMGLATTPGSPLTGATSNGGSTATTSDTAGFFLTLPSEYVDGGPITIRVRAKVSAARAVSATIVASAKKYTDGALGSELIATAAKALTTAYADYDFVVTPTGLVAGNQLWIVVTAANNDTGGSTNGITTVAAVSLVVPVFG